MSVQVDSVTKKVLVDAGTKKVLCCGCGRDVTEISTITLVSSVLAAINCPGGCQLNCSRDCTTTFTRINHSDAFTSGELQFKFWFELVAGVCTLKINFWDGTSEWGDLGPTICVRECSADNCYPSLGTFCSDPPRTFTMGCQKVNEGHLEIGINNTTHKITPYAIVDLGVNCVCFSTASPCRVEDALSCGYNVIPEVITSLIPFTYADVSGIIGAYNVIVDNTTPPPGCTSYHTHAEITITIA